MIQETLAFHVRGQSIDRIRYGMPKDSPIRPGSGNSSNSVKTAGASRPNFHTSIQDLASVLNAIPAAEELSALWLGESLPDEVCQQISAPVQVDAGKVIPLQLLKKGLDSGRTVSAPSGRGLPLWLAVRTLKASWHADGTWPLRGRDEGGLSSRSCDSTSQDLEPVPDLSAMRLQAGGGTASEGHGSDSDGLSDNNRALNGARTGSAGTGGSKSALYRKDVC
ncbi:hypothetical protein K437DRAFT_293887 [Tilletiaria anomala UBC 951]|uniref:Uncharacterized protein n=1 Tax=Tilletiaria anomala (strain ATCC 24038 / CBS 436.72 / UBC 951) TaxID=1037660 RepID=A0A066WCF0_TILAU|nr:uncharacterized protein K437DRAFT_293887 [Tilletiaria anomala UBC 951]KDN48440.1 hypothetical protein K437DRAFT_293887 [Tilletiaria anomala UBC 951]